MTFCFCFFFGKLISWCSLCSFILGLTLQNDSVLQNGRLQEFLKNEPETWLYSCGLGSSGPPNCCFSPSTPLSLFFLLKPPVRIGFLPSCSSATLGRVSRDWPLDKQHLPIHANSQGGVMSFPLQPKSALCRAGPLSRNQASRMQPMSVRPCEPSPSEQGEGF